jgi:hypothetical protein
VGVSRVEIEIEELSLHGFAPADRFRIADAIKLELARLMTERRMERPAGSRTRVAKLDAGSFRVAPHANVEGIARQAARAIHGGLVGKVGRK